VLKRAGSLGDAFAGSSQALDASESRIRNFLSEWGCACTLGRPGSLSIASCCSNECKTRKRVRKFIVSFFAACITANPRGLAVRRLQIGERLSGSIRPPPKMVWAVCNQIAGCRKEKC